MVMMIVHSDVVDPSRPMLGEAWKTSEGSIPSIGLGRDIRGLLIIFVTFFTAIDPSR